eukprot:1971830-Prymnesium_polylepis.1
MAAGDIVGVSGYNQARGFIHGGSPVSQQASLGPSHCTHATVVSQICGRRTAGASSRAKRTAIRAQAILRLPLKPFT